ncbi:MAG: hypothetical protein QOD28_1248 [Acidobacteriota bacterium]|nr:hypothetical protein [Acidobacteriota bacterium]
MSSEAASKEKRLARRRTTRHVVRKYHMEKIDGDEKADLKREFEMSPEIAETTQIVAQMARSFISTVEFYKEECGGGMPHEQAIREAAKMGERRREWVEKERPEKVSWGDIAAIGEHSMGDALNLWARIRETADDALESGVYSGSVCGVRGNPYAFAQYLAIRDSFADQWQPQGGIEFAMIDMLTVSYAMQMHWQTIAFDRTEHFHDEQRKQLDRYEDRKWKSPYQSGADAVDQAFRLADSYNRQFLRVLRQLRDLRRYAPVVIQNNGGQVNVATDGGQQVNVQQTEST